MGQTQTAELMSLASQLEEDLNSSLQDPDKHVELCRQIVLAMRSAAPNIRKVSGTRVYLGRYGIEKVLPYLTRLGGEQDKEYIEDGNIFSVKMHSARYKMFLENISCVRCGVVGEFFQLERMTDGVSHRAHFNLYGINPITKEELMMTKDHIIPRSKGSKDNLSNYQTMCSSCNGEKGNNLESTLDYHIQKYTDWVSPNEKWIVTIDKITGYPSDDSYFKHPRYIGRAIDLKKSKEHSWEKTVDGEIFGQNIPKYVLEHINKIDLVNF
jgi:hypothetical protein